MADAARMISVSDRYIYLLIAEGRLESMLLGKRRLIPVDSIKALLASARVRPGAALS